MALDTSPDSSSGTASRTGNSANGSARTSTEAVGECWIANLRPRLLRNEARPTICQPIRTRLKATYFECHPIERERMDADEVFDMIRNIQDPEHPLTFRNNSMSVDRDHVWLP
jgi:hypothetical protein